MNVEQILMDEFPTLAKYPELRKALIEVSVIHRFEQGEVILREGQYIKAIPLLASGLIKVYKEDDLDGEVLLYYIKRGESCVMSMTTLINNYKCPVKGVVEEAANVIVVPADEVLSIAKNHPGWNGFIYDTFNSKYNELIHTITTLTFSNKDSLILKYLRKEGEVKGSELIYKTHQEIGYDIGSPREVVSRILKKLEFEGFLRLSPKSIELLD